MCIHKIAFSLCVAVALISSQSESAPTRFSPGWVTQSSIAATPNQSFLENREIDPWRENYDELFLDNGTVKKLQMEYGTIQREEDARENYSTSNPATKNSYFQRVAAFSKYVFRHIINFKINDSIKKAEKNSEDVRTFRKVHEGVGGLVKGATQVSMGPNFKFGTRTDLPSQKGAVWMKSEIVNGSLDMQLGKPWAYDPWSFQSLDPNAKDETYRVSLYRGLPVWELESAMTYGGTTKTMNATISKQLAPSLRCEIGANKNLADEKPEFSDGIEETVKVSYGLTF